MTIEARYKPYMHYGVDLEKAILGACMLEKTAFSRCYGLVEAECFYVDDHKLIFQTIADMYGHSIPIDIFTVTQRIAELHGHELKGGNVAVVVCACTNHVVSAAHLEYHSFLVREMWKRREIIRLKTSFPEDEGFDTAENIRDLNEQIARIVDGKTTSDWQSMDELMFNLIIHQQDMATGKKQFLTTGFRKVDEKNGGFYGGQMIVIGARPSVGKSALMGKMAMGLAKQGKKVGIISLEMNNNEIAARLASLHTDIEFWKIYRTIARDEDLHKLFYEKISRSLIHYPIYVSDKTNVNMTDIKAKAMKLKAKQGCDILFLDYLQLVNTEGANRNYNREQEVSKMSRGVKLLAKEMDIPIVVLCQLNRANTTRSYKERFPRLSDLRESGSIEQDADVVLFIHRDSLMGYEQDEQGNDTKFQADLLAAKWRNGATFQLKLGFDPEKMNFYEQLNVPAGYKPIDFSEPGDKDETPF